MLGQMKKTAFSVSVISAVMLCMLAFSLFAVKFSTIFYILICGCAGLLLYGVQQIKQRKVDKK
jgi:chromate transporter